MRGHVPILEYPEQDPFWKHFKDTGCSLHPSCLSCPLPKCRYDDPGWLTREARDNRNVLILQRYRAGEGVTVIAASVGLSKRTIHRAVQRAEASA